MPTDPTHILVTTTATLPREGEVAGDAAKIHSLERVVATYRNREERILGDLRKRDELVAFLKEQNACLEERVDSRVLMTNDLEARNATQGEMIAGQADTIGRLQADYDAVCRDIDEERRRIANFETELAKRDETIAVRDAMLADLEETNDRQHEVLEAERSISSGLSTACCKLKIELAGRDKELASLKATLAAAMETNDLSAKVRNLHANLADAHRDVKELREMLRQSHESADESSRHARVLEGELESAETTIADLKEATMTHRDAAECQDKLVASLRREITNREETNFKLCRGLISLRTQLARAGAIEAKAKAAWREFRDGGNEGLVMTAMRQLRDSFSASPAPEPAEPKCPHCGTGISPENLTCGGCGRWLGKPAAKPTDPRLAILERVSIHAKAYLGHHGRIDRFELRNALYCALAELEAAP